jgi:hypothetical protein
MAKQIDRRKLLAEKGKAEKRLDALTAVVGKLYEDCVAGVLDSANYQNLLANYQREQRALNERTSAIDAELGQTDDSGEGLKKLKDCAAAYADFRELTAEMLNHLVERIEVGHPTHIGMKKAHQEINIIYRFIYKLRI